MIRERGSQQADDTSSVICSIGDLEEELAQRTEKLTQTARAQVAELDAAHTAHATALQTNLERTRARLKASEELAALRGRQLESHRRIVRNQAEENLVSSFTSKKGYHIFLRCSEMEMVRSDHFHLEMEIVHHFYIF